MLIFVDFYSKHYQSKAMVQFIFLIILIDKENTRNDNLKLPGFSDESKIKTLAGLKFESDTIKNLSSENSDSLLAGK